MSTIISEQTILDSLRQIPADRWDEVLRFLEAMTGAEPSIRSGADLRQSSLVGSWADRDDLGDSQQFARSPRRQAETRHGYEFVTRLTTFQPY